MTVVSSKHPVTPQRKPEMNSTVKKSPIFLVKLIVICGACWMFATSQTIQTHDGAITLAVPGATLTLASDCAVAGTGPGTTIPIFATQADQAATAATVAGLQPQINNLQPQINNLLPQISNLQNNTAATAAFVVDLQTQV